ncbi:MAG: lysine 2,3-aminomutase [Eubacteriales bacterium]
MQTTFAHKLNNFVSQKQFGDWEWQMKNRIKDAESLSRIIPLSENEQRNISTCLNSFRMAITPYYASLMDINDENCPIRRQAIPSASEMCVMPYEMADPLNEEGDSPVNHIVHRYPNRVLFLVTLQCSMYCRHCTRKRVVGEEDKIISEIEIANAVAYIRNNPQIEDVLISGGDPLTLGDKKLEYIISKIRSIPHVKIIRIGTRVPVVLPMRITPKLLTMLKKYSPIYINTHFNHPKEITPESSAACLSIVNAGIPMGNQNVLLKGINDDINILRELYMKLAAIKVRPYYMYQCDLTQGLSHFRVDVRRGMELMEQLTGYISGYAVPKYVIDAPGGGGKIPVNSHYIKAFDGSQVVLRNYKGDIYTYPDNLDL